jgi:hypothetical protein
MEPRGRGFCFPVQPESFTAGSDERHFTITDDIYPARNVDLPKPIGDRGVFRYMFGDYPITNISFADSEALGNRLYLSDLTKNPLEASSDRAHGTSMERDLPALPNRTIRSLSFSCSGSLIDSLDLFGKEHRLLKRLEYEYDHKTNPPQLISESVFLPERPMEVGFRSNVLTVRLDGNKYEFTQFNTIHEKGGRKCVVEFGQVLLSNGLVTLPVLVEVRDGASGRMLRSVRMTNFHQTKLTSTESLEAASRFAGLTPARRKQRELVNKYWGKAAEHLSDSDREVIKQLCSFLTDNPSHEENTVGEQLSRLNSLMELNLIIGNESEVERNFQRYMQLLLENSLSNMLLEGGYGVVEWAAGQGRYKQASRLLDMWVSVCGREIDEETALDFAETEIQKGDFWTCFRFLKAIPDQVRSSAEFRFERAAAVSICLCRLQALFKKRDTLESGFAKYQVELAALSLNAKQLAVLSTAALTDASRKLEATTDLSAIQKSLKTQLKDLEASRPKDERRAN